jgi:hypothetical protein
LEKRQPLISFRGFASLPREEETDQHATHQRDREGGGRHGCPLILLHGTGLPVRLNARVLTQQEGPQSPSLTFLSFCV